jgi:hypothetical protein
MKIENLFDASLLHERQESRTTMENSDVQKVVQRATRRTIGHYRKKGRG